MLVSHRKKFIYLKTIKTASTSIEVFFEKYCMQEGEWTFSHLRDECESQYGIIGFRGEEKDRLLKSPKWYHHKPASEIKELLDSKIWEEYFKFCIIRNPFEKILSYFFHKVNNELTNDKNKMIVLFRNWLKYNKEIPVDRFIYTINASICVDFFIRYEKLQQDLKYVCEQIGVPFEPESLTNLKSEYKPKNAIIEDFYDNETRDIIIKKYAFEFEFFKYNIK